MDSYFSQFEHRKPLEPIPYSLSREMLWQFLATMTLSLGAWYIIWRWGWSLNIEALWLAIPVALAETAGYIGMCLFTFNLWKCEDPPQLLPPEFFSECDDNGPRRPISVDVFFPTYNEDPELVKLSLLDAKKMTYPHPIDIFIHVLDDGQRDEMRAVAEEVGVNYLKRDNNIGFKAGNLRNALEQTHGDFLVICDADTRPFMTMLEHTLGYFRDVDVAWVQTPQWFFDLPEGKSLALTLRRWGWWPGYVVGWCIEKIMGPVEIGADPFSNDPQMFYDMIQRRRNWANASFCCGAGSVHRRNAVFEVALRCYGKTVDREVQRYTKEIKDHDIKQDLSEAIRKQAALEIDIPPYKYHVSEDLYTSIELHSDPDHDWKSVMHPQVESKMLSPQDLQSWMIQRFKYAGGAIDIAMHDNPILKRGMSWQKKVMYASTFWSNFGGLWNIIFLLAPILYLFTGIAPINSYSAEFFVHFLPYIVLSELALMVGTWGIAGFKGKASYLAFFSVNLQAIWTVLKGEQIKFPTTPKSRQESCFVHLVWPQATVMLLTLTGIIFAAYQYMLQGHAGQLNGLLANTFWGINNIAVLGGLVMAAFWKPEKIS